MEAHLTSSPPDDPPPATDGVKDPDLDPESRVARLRRATDLQTYTALLIAVIAIFVLQAALPQTPGSRAVLLTLEAATLLLSLRLGGFSRHWRVVVWVIVLAAMLTSVVTLFAIDDTANTAGSMFLLNGLLVALAPVAIFAALRRHESVTVATLMGSLCIYVLIGLFFAFLYQSLHQYNDAAFVTSGSGLSPAALQYFSFVTITTLGFGDITPATDVARTATVLEALFGQVYLVTVVALVVSRLGRPRRD